MQSVTCLATDASPAADPGVASLIPAQPQTFEEVDHEIISTVILLLLLIQEGFSITKGKFVHEVLVNCLVKLVQEKVWLGVKTVSTSPHLLTGT